MNERTLRNHPEIWSRKDDWNHPQPILNKRRQWNHSAILTRRDYWNHPQLVNIEWKKTGEPSWNMEQKGWLEPSTTSQYWIKELVEPSCNIDQKGWLEPSLTSQYWLKEKKTVEPSCNIDQKEWLEPSSTSQLNGRRQEPSLALQFWPSGDSGTSLPILVKKITVRTRRCTVWFLSYFFYFWELFHKNTLYNYRRLAYTHLFPSFSNSHSVNEWMNEWRCNICLLLYSNYAWWFSFVVPWQWQNFSGDIFV